MKPIITTNFSENLISAAFCNMRKVLESHSAMKHAFICTKRFVTSRVRAAVSPCKNCQLNKSVNE